MEKNDYKYFNVVMVNRTDSDIPATFHERRVQPILDEMSDYEIGIIRWKISGLSFPLFIWEEDKYFVSLSAGNEIYVQEVTNPHTNHAINYYEEFVDMVNAAFDRAWDELIEDDAHPEYKDITSSPEILYDSGTKLFYIVTQIKEASQTSIYYPTARDDHEPIEIYFSTALWKLFRGFPSDEYNVHDNADYRIHVLEAINNRRDQDYFYRPTVPDGDLPKSGYVVTPTSFPCLNAWHSINRIIMTTTLPVETEDIGFKDSPYNASGLPMNQAILTDFEVIKSEQNALDDIIFYSNNEKRYLNFASTGQLKEMDLSIYWETNDQKPIPLMLKPGEEANVKIQFCRRWNQDLKLYKPTVINEKQFLQIKNRQ